MKNDNSRARPRVHHKGAAQPQANARPPVHVSPPVAAPRTRLIRFRLNPRSDGDQQILSWLAQVAPYYRADAIRTALLTHILRRGGGTPSPIAMPNATDVVPSASPTTAQKLEKMFSA
jgi:hypothetical protein